MKTGWHDALTLAGIAGATYGLYLVHPALAWLAGGGLVAFIGIWINAQKGRQ